MYTFLHNASPLPTKSPSYGTNPPPRCTYHHHSPPSTLQLVLHCGHHHHHDYRRRTTGTSPPTKFPTDTGCEKTSQAAPKEIQNACTSNTAQRQGRPATEERCPCTSRRCSCEAMERGCCVQSLAASRGHAINVGKTKKQNFCGL